MSAQGGNEVPRPSFWTDHRDRGLLTPSHEAPNPQLTGSESTEPELGASLPPVVQDDSNGAISTHFADLPPVAQVSTQGHNVVCTDVSLAGLTRSPSNESSDGDQPPAAANGTYSESLTRLQKGYLMVISNLESCNKELQQEMENMVSRQRDDEAQRDENAFGAQDYARLKQQHSHLQQQHYEMHEEMTNELNSLRQSNAVLQCMAAVNGNHHQTIQGRDEKIRFLQNNVLTFKDAHRRVAADLEAEKKRYANLEAANRRLAEALEAERKKDETIRTLNETNTANTLKLIQVEEVHRRLQAALKEERRKNERIRDETNKDETIKEDEGMTEDTDERINKKNATIRDKNSQINQLKEANRKVEEALKAEKRKNRAPGKTGPRAHAIPTKRTSVNVGGPAQKKPKLESNF